jgi:Thioesterase-like superfamily
VEAARVAMICDLLGWPSVVRALDPGVEEQWIAPNLDLSVTFHQPPGGSEFLLLDAQAPIAAGGTVDGIGGNGGGAKVRGASELLLLHP